MSTNAEVFPYPANVPDCQQKSAETFGIACGPCPFAPECGYLALSREMIESERSTEERIINERIESNRDELLPGFYNRTAVRAMIEKDTELANELLQGRAAMVMIDVRGLHAVNEKYGMDSGDTHLVHSADRLLYSAGGVRFGKRPKKTSIEKGDDMAQTADRNTDIGIRDGKADEMYVLLRDITPSDLPRVVNRLEKAFSVSRAIRDARKGRWPIPATISSAHSAEVVISEHDSAISIFESTYNTVRDRHGSLKSGQYAEMWQRVCDATNQKDRRVPEDARMIFDKFIIECCGDFVRIMASQESQQ